MKFLVLNIAFLAVFACSGLAGEDGGTTSPFSFGMGTRDLAMGGSVFAESDASSSPFWNSSRLATVERYSVTGSHGRLYFPGNVYQYLGMAIPTLDQGGFGLGIFRQGIDGIEKRDRSNQLLGETQDNQIRFYLAHGRSWSGFNLGLAATLEYHSLDGLSAASSPGLDLSAGKRFFVNYWWLRKVSAAINVRNIVRPGIRLADELYRYPIEFKTGLAFDLQPSSSEDHRLVISTSLTEPQSAKTRLALGVEYTLMNILSLRGGVSDGKLSVGVGLQYSGIGFDYAVVDRDFGSIHLISLTTFFGRPKSARQSDRIKKREVEFKSVMNEQLTARNRILTEELIASGKQSMDSLKYAEAANEFDRALFLARSNGTDTSVIIELHSSARKELDRISQQQQYELCLDSAQACVSRLDHIAAKYFAGQALTIKSESDLARNIYESTNQALTEVTDRDKMIADKLAAVDAALAIGKYDQASSLLKLLEDFAPDDDGVQMRAIKIDYEILKFKLENSAQYTENLEKYDHTQIELDTTILKRNSTTDVIPKGDVGAMELPKRVTADDLSHQLRKEVDEAYSTAKQDFEKGQLNRAVILWEKVDRLAPGYKVVREYLAKAYTFVGVNLYAQRKREESLVAWHKVIRLDPDNAEVRGYIQRTQNEINKLKVLSYED